jgi:hypothetical protein
MKKLIEQYLLKLKEPFDSEWIFNFHSLIDIFYKHPQISKLIKELIKEKQKQYAPVVKNLKKLVLATNISIENIQNILKEDKSVDEKIKKEIKEDIFNIISSQQYLVDEKNSSFLLKNRFGEYNILQYVLAKKLIMLEKVELLSKFLTNTSPHCQNKTLEIKFGFADILDTCQQEVDSFINKSKISLWGKWDLVLEWLDWTKDGIANDVSGTNLTNVFNKYKFGDVIQSIGLYFLEQLSFSDNLAKDLSVKAFELYLDKDNRYWIIVHLNGENESKPYFVKKITSISLLDFLKKLLNATDNTEFERTHKTSHLLNELLIKNELLKVFYPASKKFAGSYVELSSLSIPIDAQIIIDELTKLQSERKTQIYFNYGQYYKNKSFIH